MIALIQLVNLAFDIYRWLLLARIILSWFPNMDHGHPAMRFLYRATEPILRPFRQIIPPIGGMIDISPIVVFFLLNFVQRFVVRLLFNLAF